MGVHHQVWGYSNFRPSEHLGVSRNSGTPFHHWFPIKHDPWNKHFFGFTLSGNHHLQSQLVLNLHKILQVVPWNSGNLKWIDMVVSYNGDHLIFEISVSPASLGVSDSTSVTRKKPSWGRHTKCLRIHQGHSWNGIVVGQNLSGWWFWALPLWKMMDFVSWDDDIPNIWINHFKKTSHQPEPYLMINLSGMNIQP